MPTNPAECKGILSGAEKSCRVSRNPGGCQETLPGAMESCRVPWNPAGCHGILPGTMESCLVPRCSRFVTIHVGGTSKGGRGDVGETLGGGDVGGTVGRRGDDNVLTHALLKILHSLHYAAAMLMTCAVTHSDVSLISACAVTQ